MGVWRIARAGEQTKSNRLPSVAHVWARGRYYNNVTITAALQAGNITVSWLWLVGWLSYTSFFLEGIEGTVCLEKRVSAPGQRLRIFLKQK